MSLTLLVPDLLPLVPAPEAASLRLPALETWIARAQSRREPGTGSRWLLAQWGLAEDAPVAALTLAADGGPREGHWLRAAPVHQRVEGNGLVLHDATALALSREECEAAIAELNRFFAADGLEFVAPARDRWYVRVPAGELPRTVPLEAVAGRNPFGMLPEGAGRLAWPSLFSEAQMLLAGLAFNREREAQGRPALNAVWFWGGGAWPAALPRPFAAVAADASLPRALALASGCAVQSLPPGLAQLPSPGSAETLAVVDTLTLPRHHGDREAWLAAARALDRDWFVPLGRALGVFGRIRIVLPGERDTAVFELTGQARWRFFRRARPIHVHA
ncbi:MAG: hypothetical protein FIB05_14260 [Betaproteobacteria bacterium]|nr:hypothetical protein [Betaproteobacteria bacterium]